MCTSFRLRADDGSIVVGRTMEFAADLDSQLLVVPAGTSFTGTAPEGTVPASWTTTHGFIGLDALGHALVVDGMNDAGLSVGVLYFPGFVGYQEPAAEGNLAPEELANLLLGTCADVAEVREAVAGVRVWASPFPALGASFPLHYIVNDRSGAGLVVEHVDGELRLHDNPLGVATNAPSFDWHLTNLRNFTRLTATNVPGIDALGITVKPLGQGSGLLGLPGDWTPPSRFVRAAVLCATAHHGADSAAAARVANHLIYALDIPLGVVREHGPDGPEELTQWASISDLDRGILYVRYYGDPFIHEVSLADALATAGDGAVRIPLTSPDTPWTVPVDLSAAHPAA